jgi:hypothetical protein
VLGDSCVEAVQVDEDQRFTNLVEQSLSQLPGMTGRVEVLNFGVSGYGTAQQLQTLRHRVWQFEPDYVVIAVCTGNDIRNNSRRLEGNPAAPYFVFEDGKLTLDTSFRDAPEHRKSWWKRAGLVALEYSRIAQLARRAYTLRTARRAAEASTQGQSGDAGTGLVEAGLDTAVYVEPQDEAWREAWRVTEGILALAHQECRARGARLLVVTLSNAAQVHPDVAARRRLATSLGVTDLFYPERRIAACAAREGFDVLHLAPELARRSERDGVYFHGFANTAPGTGHWNAAGLTAAAEIVTRWLIPMIAPVR